MRFIKFSIVLAIMLIQPYNRLWAQDERQYINYFYVKGDICLPITVKHSRGSFVMYSDYERHDGALSYVEAYDCHGRKIISPVLANDGYSTDKNKPVVREYVFEYLYPEETGGQGNDNNHNNNNGSGGSGSWDKLDSSVREGAKRYDPAYSNITFQAGLSRVHGEFLRAKACLGGQTGVVLYGGIGRDWLFTPNNDDYIGPDAKTLAWHVGLGYYGGDLNGETTTGEFAFLMDYSETPLVDNGALNMWLEGTWYFGADGHFGAFAGIGASGGRIKCDDFKFNFIFEVGLAYRFF